MKKIYTFTFRTEHNLREYAKMLDVNISQFINIALNNYIKKLKKKMQQEKTQKNL